MPRLRRRETQLALDWPLPGRVPVRWGDLAADLRDQVREQLIRLLRRAAQDAHGVEGGDDQ